MAEHTAESDQAMVTELGKRMKMDKGALTTFVDHCMRGLGYDFKRTYYTIEKESRNGGFFGGGKNSTDEDSDF
jgi:hypothetical protein